MIGRAIRKFNRLIKERQNRINAEGKTKYFCIGLNKTGTTSLKKAFEDIGYPVGNQRKAEIIADRNYFIANFPPIVDYCQSAQVFQDVPFSWPATYKWLDQAYPNSRFILTLRDDGNQWYESLTKFHTKLFGKGHLPIARDLQEANYVSKGFAYRSVALCGAPENDLYNKEVLLSHYHRYNQEVQEYFVGRPDDLLVINLAEKGSYQKFIQFLGVDSPYREFPWENKT